MRVIGYHSRTAGRCVFPVIERQIHTRVGPRIILFKQHKIPSVRPTSLSRSSSGSNLGHRADTAKQLGTVGRHLRSSSSDAVSYANRDPRDKDYNQCTNTNAF